MTHLVSKRTVFLAIPAVLLVIPFKTISNIISPHSSNTSLNSGKYLKSTTKKRALSVALIAILSLVMLAGSPIHQARAATAGIDGHATTQSDCSSSCTVTLTTSNPDDVIYLAFASVTAPTTNPPTVADSAGLTWTLRGSNTYLFTWYAIALNALTSDIITVTAADSNPTADLFAFGVSGSEYGRAVRYSLRHSEHRV